jgi:glutamyl-Q tRNA(Asp) synthetase
VLTRFAPAPTGYLHLGHVVNAMHVWGVARAEGGRVSVRIEDHDRQRSRLAFELAILEDLAWLGFIGDGPVVRQREREAVYRAALGRLVAQDLVYGCDCTRTAVRRAGAGPEVPTRHPDTLRGTPSELRYPNTCRDRGLPLGEGLGWRVRLSPGVEHFDDRWLGPQVQDPTAQCGDLLIRDRLGNWTYQFAVVADDMAQGVTDVIRGRDLLDSTGRQIQLARMLGRPVPARFGHHPLVMKSATEKLSKSDGDTGIRDLRAAGWSAADVLARAAALSETGRPSPGRP